MNGVLTLLTDFGNSHYPSILKGVILSRCPDLQLIDITHHCPAFQIRAAAFILAQVVRQFRMPSVHLIVVDPGVGTDRDAIAVSIGDDRFLVGPDNGVLSWAMSGTKYEARKLDMPDASSITFHGRDVFAPVAAELACGYRDFQSIGQQVDPIMLPRTGFEAKNGKIHARVLFVDNFGNIIVSVHRDDQIFRTKERLQVVVDKMIFQFQYGTYGKVSPDGLCWHYDSSGYIELSVREGSFAGRSGLGWEDSVILQQVDYG